MTGKRHRIDQHPAIHKNWWYWYEVQVAIHSVEDAADHLTIDDRSPFWQIVILFPAFDAASIRARRQLGMFSDWLTRSFKATFCWQVSACFLNAAE